MADLNQTQPEEGSVAGTESIIEADKEDPTLVVTLLANELETRLNKSGAILEITSRSPEVNSAPFAVQLVLSYMAFQEMPIYQKEKWLKIFWLQTKIFK